jgi:hypothetical protein
MHPGLEMRKLLIRESQEHLVALEKLRFMIGQKSPFYLTMELFQTNLSISLTQSNTTIWSSDLRKNSTKSTDQIT